MAYRSPGSPTDALLVINNAAARFLIILGYENSTFELISACLDLYCESNSGFFVHLLELLNKTLGTDKISAFSFSWFQPFLAYGHSHP